MLASRVEYFEVLLQMPTKNETGGSIAILLKYLSLRHESFMQMMILDYNWMQQHMP